jgi:peptidase, M23/M37 family
MYTAFKKTAILLAMLLVILGISSFATKYNFVETEISFENGVKIDLTTSKNINSETVLKENNISVLEHEKVEEKFQDSKRIIRIISDNSKTNVVTSFTVSENSNIQELINNKMYNNLTEKIEVVEIEIPFNTITRQISNSKDSHSQVVQEGKNGIKIIKYRLLYNNNELIEKVELSSEVKVKPVDKIVEVTSNVVSRKLETPRNTEENKNTKTQSQEQQKVSYSNSRWSYSAEEFDLICAITAQESSTSYEGALAVISTAINRANSSKWKRYGKDPLSQYKGTGQFTYSIDGLYKKRLNGKYSSAVKQAVIDGLNGKTNHNYLSFRSASHARKHGISGVTIGDNTFYSN